MWRMSAKFVPKLLTEEQKELWKEICKNMLDCANHEPEFLKTIITGNETWVYGYEPRNKIPIFPMETSRITMTQKSMAGLEQGEK